MRTAALFAHIRGYAGSCTPPFRRRYYGRLAFHEQPHDPFDKVAEVESHIQQFFHLLGMDCFVVYGCFGLAQSKTGKGKGISLGVIVAAIAFLFYKYSNLEGAVDVEAPIFQQFNPCYVVALTPVSVALFSWLHKIGKEPTSPEKIGLGMLVAALGFVWMAVGSMGLELPLTQGDPATEGTRVSANLLISTYLILTFAELLLSPIGISFVSKVAPPKYEIGRASCRERV